MKNYKNIAHIQNLVRDLPIEALDSEEIRVAARTRLTSLLLEGYIYRAKELLDLNLLKPADLQTEEIRAAARTGLTSLLLEGAIGRAKELLDLNLLKPADLQTEENRAAARARLTSLLSKGAIGRAKELLDLNLLEPADLQTEENRVAARTGLTRVLSKGNFHEAKELLDLNLLKPADLQMEEIREAARTGLTRVLSEGNFDEAKGLFDLNLLNSADLQTVENREAARTWLTRVLSKGNFDEAKKLFDLNLLEPEEIAEAARARLTSLLLEGAIGRAKELLDLNLLKPADLQTEENREAARTGLTRVLSKGNFHEAKKLFDLNLLNSADLQTVENREAARTGLTELLSGGDPGRAKELFDLNLLEPEEIAEAARTGLTSLLLEGYIYEAKQLLDLNWLKPADLQTEENREAARTGLTRVLSKGNFHEAKELLDLNWLNSADLQTVENREAARTGLTSLLSKVDNNIDEAKKLFDLNLLEPEEIAEAARTVLTSLLSEGGYIGRAEELLDLNLLKPEEIAEAARTVLTSLLSGGNIGGAKELLDLNLLKPEEIRAAARTGLTSLLSEGYLDDSKKLLDLNLLKPEEIAESARTGLTSLLSKDYIGGAKALLDLKLIKQPAIDNCFRQSAKLGYVTSVIRSALFLGMDFDSALDLYLGISKLKDENAAQLFEELKSKDPLWNDPENIQRPFEEGAAIFGAARMLQYVFKANARPHDALFAFHNIVQLYQISGLEPQAFFGNILAQVNRDDGVDDTGNAFSRLNSIAQGFPADIATVLDEARKYPDIPRLKDSTDSFPDKNAIFASWLSLQRFAKLLKFLKKQELLPEIQRLRQSNQPKLADWVETLAFHPASNIAQEPILDFWRHPERFLAKDEVHAPEMHERKKPSHYTDIPHLDLTATQLRDALIDGTLDRLQVFSPMRVEYKVGGADVSLSDELKRALGSHRENIPGDAKNPKRLFTEVANLLKAKSLTITQVLAGVELPDDVRQELEALIYNTTFGVTRPPDGMRLIAEIHSKSDPLAAVAGSDTASCMGFGTGKNNVYLFNPNTAQFTVRLVRPDGSSRTIAQSVLTKNVDVKMLVPDIMKQMQGSDRAALHTIIPPEALRGQKSIITADNVEVHPNYKSGEYPEAIEAVFRDFFSRYAESHSEGENLQPDSMIIGMGYSDTMNSLPRVPNTSVPLAPVGYSDNWGNEAHTLSLTEPQRVPLRVLSVVDNKVENRINPQAAIIPGITPLTFEDTLSLAYIEGKVYEATPSLREGLHNMENALIAADINNAQKGRPNLSIKYNDPEGRMKGYLFAYEGKASTDGAESFDDGAGNSRSSKQPVIYISDFTNDARTNANGEPVISFVGGKLLLEFGRLYKENYLDKGNMIPIYTNARDETSYKLLRKQLDALGKKIGYRLEMQDVGKYTTGTSTMHNVLIVPHKIEELQAAGAI
jgi:hypothetical protein